MSEIEIIIVDYYSRDYLQQCIQSILCNSDAKKINIKIVDNAKDNIPLTKLWNKMIRECNSDMVFVLNPDVLVASHWDSLMINAMKDKVAAINPSSNIQNCPSYMNYEYSSFIKKTQKVSLSDFDNINKSLKEISDFCSLHFKNQNIEAQSIYGFCFLLNRRLFLELGGFDEKFTLYGQDSEYFMRCRRLGYLTIWCKEAFVWHYGAQSRHRAVKAGILDFEKERKKSANLYQHYRNNPEEHLKKWKKLL